jgi:hypothetical protein
MLDRVDWLASMTAGAGQVAPTRSALDERD